MVALCGAVVAGSAQEVDSIVDDGVSASVIVGGDWRPAEGDLGRQDAGRCRSVHASRRAVSTHPKEA